MFKSNGFNVVTERERVYGKVIEFSGDNEKFVVNRYYRNEHGVYTHDTIRNFAVVQKKGQSYLDAFKAEANKSGRIRRIEESVYEFLMNIQKAELQEEEEVN